MVQFENNPIFCSACKALTFVQLLNGYDHPLNYRATVQSGKSCRLCRLIVCSMAKLQLHCDSYGLELQYNSMAGKLPSLPILSRHELVLEGALPLVEVMKLPSDLKWDRQEYIGEPNYETQVRKGNFNGGETIQISATESLMAIRPIDARSKCADV